MRRGLVSPPALLSTDVPPRKPVMPFRQLERELDQDRGER
jgi:hypothetical protein